MRSQARVLATMLALAASGCAAGRPLGTAVEQPTTAVAREIDIAITRKGFEPARAPARVGETVRLVFTRKVEHTCVTQVLVWLAEGRTIERELPIDRPVAITLELTAPGELGFACPMHMFGGWLDVK